MAADTFVRKFKIPTLDNDSSIKGVSNSSIRSSSSIDLIIGSRNNKFALNIQAEVVPANCLSYSASVSFPLEIIEKLEDLELAEPCLGKENAKIQSVDMVIGAKYFAKCLVDGKAQIDTLDLQRSKFGWIVSGVAPTSTSCVSQFCGLTLNDINQSLERFWQIENVEDQDTPCKVFSSEEKECVTHFENTFSYADDGKFVVKLPLKRDRNEIARTRNRAENSLLRVEKKLGPKLKCAYSDFMKEYLDLGHMSEVAYNFGNVYHIPHREIIRESSSTTPLRVVFNASAKAGGKLSLNDALTIGPNLQRDLFDILITFRKFEYVCVGDAEKMYRMIWVHKDDRDLQRILWRFSASEPIREYQLNTLTYGTAPASFIAQKCLMKIAESNRAQYPEVANIIEKNFYMDDVNIGAAFEKELMLVSKKVCSVLKNRGFNLRKFASNSINFLSSLAPELRAINKNQISSVENSEVSVLGLTWNPSLDEISVRADLSEYITVENVSRRVALSAIAKTFDPLGLLAPVLIKGKLLLQEFWREKKDWDSLTSDELNDQFQKYVEETILLNNIKIPRYIGANKIQSLFAFCDASEKACCAIVYARHRNYDGNYYCKQTPMCQNSCSSSQRFWRIDHTSTGVTGCFLTS